MIALRKRVGAREAIKARRSDGRVMWGHPKQLLRQIRPVIWTCLHRATNHEPREKGDRTIQLGGVGQVRKAYRQLVIKARAIWVALLSGRTR